MKFIIRDDDTCAFTSPDELEACYRDISQLAPVSLSVTPFRIPGNDRSLPDSMRGNMEVMPLEQNRELVDYLRDGIRDGRLDITQHGYHHWRCGGLPEFVGCDELERKAREGKAYLDELLGVDVRTFVPPNNEISITGVDAICAAGMNLATVLGLRTSFDRRRSLSVLSLFPYFTYLRLRGIKYPGVIDMHDHQEVTYYTVGPAQRSTDLSNELSDCHGRDGVFVLATHYHAFDRTMQDGVTVRESVYSLIEQADALGDVEFTGFNSLWA